MQFDKITQRLDALSFDLRVDSVKITQSISSLIFSGITTQQVDELCAHSCINLVFEHPDYCTLASRILISNHHRQTPSRLLDAVTILYYNIDSNKESMPMISEKYYKVVSENAEKLENAINYKRDFSIDFFGFKTLEKSYLLRAFYNNKMRTIERPQHMFMRVALCMYPDDLDKAIAVYDRLSLKHYVHASPTLFNAGTPKQSLASCFLLGVEDSIDGIFDKYRECGVISKWAGGIGIHLHKIRSSGSMIKSTGGQSLGVLPMLKTLNCIAHQFNQGGKRLGSFAVYLAVDHPDIMAFLSARKNQGSEHERARDLFYALWVPDLFMKRVQSNEKWSLFCPKVCPLLNDVYGERYEALYAEYEAQGLFKEQVNARDIWRVVLDLQVETGMPYVLYKDAINKKSNQQNIGVVRSSNLCCEITEVSDENETAVCNLASICLPSVRVSPLSGHSAFLACVDSEGDSAQTELARLLLNASQVIVETISGCSYCVMVKALLVNNGMSYLEVPVAKPPEDMTYPQVFVLGDDGVKRRVGGFMDTLKLLRPRVNFEMLRKLSYELVFNLNQVIDVNDYSVANARTSNLRHRPVGIGVQGLGDLFMAMKLPFDSEESRRLNRDIFETIYYGAVEASVECARRKGAYETFAGSPMSRGVFQFDMWGVSEAALSGRHDWGALREEVQRVGMRNSLLVSLMPTASTSQIMGSYCEAFEPLTSNLYLRRTLAGEFVLFNKYLVNDLLDLGLWNEDMRNKLQFYRGSVQLIKEIPALLRDVYRTAFEIQQSSLIKMSAERAPFVCQSQSLNLFFKNTEKLNNAHFYGWKLGLKTGSYYIRTQAGAISQRFGMDIEVEKELTRGCEGCSA